MPVTTFQRFIMIEFVIHGKPSITRIPENIPTGEPPEFSGVPTDKVEEPPGFSGMPADKVG
jgi:hypothetical protein